MPSIANEQEQWIVEPLLPECLKNERQKLSIDEVLKEWAGELGPAQFLHFTLVSLAWCVPCLLTFTMVFADRTPQWACVPTSNNLQLRPYPQRRDFAQESGFCTPTSSICSLDPSLWAWINDADESTVSQWMLICNNSYKVGLVQSLFFTGALLGAGVCGRLSDTSLGRRGVLIVTCSLGSILGLLTAFAPNYWVYVGLRMATGFTIGGMGTSAFVLATELVGPSKRGPLSMSIFFVYSCTIMLISVLAYFASPWRKLYLLSSVPCILYCLLILPLVGESPRWYLARGKADMALAILKQVAQKNGRSIPETITLEIENTDMPQNGVAMKRADSLGRCKVGTIDIFRTSSLRKSMMIMLFIWLSNGLIYYGINLNVSNVGDNISLGLILNAVCEMPAYVVTAVIIQRYGRRVVLVCALLLSGISSLGGALAGGTIVRMGCGMMTIFGIAASYNLVFIYTAELFPTEVRNAAMGLATQAAHVGTIAAPLAAISAHIYGWLPFMMFFITAIISSCLACFLPETLEKPMHETIQGMLKSKDPL